MLNIKSTITLSVAFTRCLALFFAALCIAACESDSPELIEPTDKTGGSVLSMNIMTAQVDHMLTGLEYGLDFENEIKFNDSEFHFLIFHGQQNDYDAPLIFDSSKAKSADWEHYGNPKVGYRCFINVESLKFTKRPSPDEQVPLTVVCIAGVYQEAPSISNSIWISDSNIKFEKLSDIVATKLPYKVSTSWYPGTSGTSSKLPLFGMISTTIPAGVLFDGLKYPIIDIDETIWMLRPMAKIMLIDALEKKDEVYPRLCLDGNYTNKDGKLSPLPEGSRLTSNSVFYNSGYLIPNDFKNGVQVTKANLNASSKSSLTTLTRLMGDTDIELNGVKKSYKYLPFYLPEQSLYEKTAVGVERKEIYIPVEYEKGKVVLRTLVLDDYYNECKGYLLRNHVYCLAVTKFNPPARSSRSCTEMSEPELTVTADYISPEECMAAADCTGLDIKVGY